MPEYCESSDVQARLTEAGVKNLADRNRDGAVSGAPETGVLSSAIVWAGTEIDAAICEKMPPATARGASNGWLKERAIALAAFRASTIGGRSATDSIKADYERTVALLEAVENGSKTVPGLNYELPYDTKAKTMQGPRVVNVC